MGTTTEVTPEQRGLVKSDGRNVDLDVGTLAGEGSQQRVRALEAQLPAGGAFQAVPSEAFAAQAGPTYYGQPSLKAPVWKPLIGLYFYVGGAAGSASALGAAATLLDGARLKRLSTLCRSVAAAGDVLSAGLLIADLGRPSRFLNMMRVFRPTSPMSVGTYILALSGGCNTAALLLSERSGLLRGLGRGADYAGGALGLPLSGYTAVLLVNTAVPVWQGARRSMPVLFLGSAMASATALLDLFALSPAEARLTRRMGIVGKAVALAASFAMEREVGRVAEVARPLKEGVSGALWTAAKVLTASSLALALLPGQRRWTRALAGGLATAGALALRLGVYQAGKPSANNPRATFAQQRAGLGAMEVTGAAAVAGPSAKPAVFKLPVLP